MTSTFFLFGGLERLILVAVYFKRRLGCWSANVLEYSEDLQLRPVLMKQQCKTALGLWTQ